MNQLKTNFAIWLFVTCAGIFCTHVTAAEVDQSKFDFAHDVLPVLKTHCAKCHSNGTYKGGFSIDTRATIIESGAVRPGSATESDLVDRIQSDDEDYRMPREGAALAAQEIAALKKWIDLGVPWQTGFSFKEAAWRAPLAPRPVNLPPGNGNPIDRLGKAYFSQNEVPWPDNISDAVFMRRAYLDLIGLLPNSDELRQFVEDTAEDKRTRLVDALLGRRHDYADHWISFWNDLLRNDYSGTGYIDGGRKQITRWLHRSLYENKPYDQFVRELVSPTDESAGFIRGIQWRGRVNASQVREVQFAQNVSQVFLGENLKCASCHDSFINDWKLADAYGMAAIVAEQPLEMFRCDKPTGQPAEAKFLWPQLGTIDPQLPQAERLEIAAKLVTRRENGRFTRTIVNRLWQRMMGRAIVEPVDMMSAKPYSPDLLDFLAEHLAENGFDLKQTLRLIATSRIYQARTVTQRETPKSDFVFRGPLARRMTAEQFVDAVWSLTNAGPQEIVAKIDDYDASPPALIRASLVHSDLLMRSLGRPNREQVVTTRADQLSTLQALDLSNGQILYDVLQRGAENIVKQFPESDKMIEHLYMHALSREPVEDERAIVRSLLGEKASAEVAADVLWMIVMLPEFQHVR